MRHIRHSEVIDRNAPELVDLFDHLRDTLLERHGVTKARYIHVAPSIAGLRLKVSASPALRPLAVDFVENRRHELLFDLAERLRRAGPTRFANGGDRVEMPERLQAARRQYDAEISRFIGEGWWHGFEVPAFGPSGHDGLFLINAPLEQPLSNRYIADVRRDLLEFHLAYADVELLAEPLPRLAAGEHDLLLGFASGLRTEAIAAETDRSQRATEDRLKKLRNRLESATTIEAAMKAVRLGLIL